MAEIWTYPEILCMSLLPASLKKIWSKTTEKRWLHRFPHYKSMGAFCCHGNQSFDPICPKTLRSLSSTLMMRHIKFDQGWPTSLRDIQVSSEKLWQNDTSTELFDRTTESRRTRQTQYSPHFFKHGYHNLIGLQRYGCLKFSISKYGHLTVSIHTHEILSLNIWCYSHIFITQCCQILRLTD